MKAAMSHQASVANGNSGVDHTCANIWMAMPSIRHSRLLSFLLQAKRSSAWIMEWQCAMSREPHGGSHVRAYGRSRMDSHAIHDVFLEVRAPLLGSALLGPPDTSWH